MSVRVATTTSILLDKNTTTLDGVTLTDGDLVLVKNQTGNIQNGVYIVSTSGTWSRSPTMATGSNAFNQVIFVISGTSQSGESYQCTSSPSIVGTNALVFDLYNNTYQLLWGAPAHGNPAIVSRTSVSNAINAAGTTNCCIAWNGTIYVAVKYGTINYSTSPNGTTWTARTLPASTNCVNIVWGGGLFLITTNGTQGYSSPDGITWTSQTIPTANQKYALTYGNGIFVALNYNNSAISTSPDGITWTSRTGSSRPWIAVAWSGLTFAAIAGGFGASNAVITSPDGITWTEGTVPTSQNWQGMAWNGTVFCSVATSSSVAITSPDGITWTERTLPSSTTWQYIIAIGSYLVAAAGGSTTFALSVDNGLTWSSFTAAASFLSTTTQGGTLATNGASFVGGSTTNTAILTSFSFPNITASIGGNAVYTDTLVGITLVPATNNQTGYVNWNIVGFDFTRDFQLNFCIYQGSGADGIFVGVGGSAAFTAVGTTNGGLVFVYNTFSSNQNDNFVINGTAVGNIVPFHSGVTYTNEWQTCSLVVRTCGTKKIALANTGSSNSIDNGYDVSNWAPSGTYVAVGARTGASNAGHYVNFVSLQYIS